MVINIHDGESHDHDDKGGGCGSGGCSKGTCGNGLEKIYPTAAVRYGYMKSVGEFRYPSEGMMFGCGANVIIQTTRGIEMGEMVSLTCDGCDKCVSRDQIRSYVEASGPDYYNFGEGRILRLASKEDLAEWEHIKADALPKRRFCQEQADRKNLPMKVLECEHLFGGERVIFFFMAEGRVDFRLLVRELAEEFQTRIEMRQVGARDEARLLADYETCGRECCCKNFLKTLKPISMKMAKMQKATLDPAKVSGRCGRLKCCLRYEHVSYEELDRKLPRHGTRVFTAAGQGIVIGRQILTQLLQVQTDDGGRLAVAVEDLLDEAEAERLAEEKRTAANAVRPPVSPFRGGRSGRGRKPGPGDARPASGADRERSSKGADGGLRAEDQAQAGPTGSEGKESDDAPRRRRRGRRRVRRKSNRPADGGAGPPSGDAGPGN